MEPAQSADGGWVAAEDNPSGLKVRERVNVSAISSGSTGLAPSTYSPASSPSPMERCGSPFTDGPSSSAFLSRTNSLGSEAAQLPSGSPALPPPAAAEAGPRSRPGSGGAAGEEEEEEAAREPLALTAPALKALQKTLSRRGSLTVRTSTAAAATGEGGAEGGGGDGTSGSGTPDALPPAGAPLAPLSIEAALQGISISGAATPQSVATTPSISFQAAPSSTSMAPVEVFARFPSSSGDARPSAQPPSPANGAGAFHPSASAPAFAHQPSTPQRQPRNGGPPADGSWGRGGVRGAGAQPSADLAAYMGGQGSGGPGYYAAGLQVYAGSYPPPNPHFYPQSPHAAAATLPAPYVLGGFPGAGPAPPFYAAAAAPTDGMYGAPAPLSQRGSYDAGAASPADFAQWQYQAALMAGYGMPMFGTSVDSQQLPSYHSTPRTSHWAGSEELGSPAWGARSSRSAALAARASFDSASLGARSSDSSEPGARMDPDLAALVMEDSSDLRSPLLEKYWAARGEGRHWSMETIRGQLYPFCKDQYGSRLVQQGLDAADPETLTSVFKELQPKLLHLCVGVFGNYVVQKLLERGSAEVRAGVVSAMRGRVLLLSLQMYGCRVVQKALEVLDQEGKASLCSELCDHTLRCVRDQNGNHVVQKCIETVQPSDPIRPMIEAIVSRVPTLSTHTFGCRLVQRVLQQCTIPELVERTIASTLELLPKLADDQFGNYVVQHLVTRGPPSARAAVIEQLAPNVATLAQHKFASNVIEACLAHGNQQQRDLLLGNLLSEVSASPNTLLTLMKGQYGNYVAQRCLVVATEPQREALLQAMRPHLPTVRKYTHGKHIASKVDALLQERALGAHGAGLGPVPGPPPHGFAPSTHAVPSAAQPTGPAAASATAAAPAAGPAGDPNAPSAAQPGASEAPQSEAPAPAALAAA